MTDEGCKKIGAALKSKWADPVWAAKMREKQRLGALNRWKKPEEKAKQAGYINAAQAAARLNHLKFTSNLLSLPFDQVAQMTPDERRQALMDFRENSIKKGKDPDALYSNQGQGIRTSHAKNFAKKWGCTIEEALSMSNNERWAYAYKVKMQKLRAEFVGPHIPPHVAARRTFARKYADKIGISWEAAYKIYEDNYSNRKNAK